MNYVGRKLYFDKNTGNVILDTGEKIINVKKTSFLEDIAFYEILRNYEINDIDFIELGYGQFREDFNDCESLYIDTVKKEIVFVK